MTERHRNTASPVVGTMQWTNSVPSYLPHLHILGKDWDMGDLNSREQKRIYVVTEATMGTEKYLNRLINLPEINGLDLVTVA